MTQPKTDFILVRQPRITLEDGGHSVDISIVRNNGKFDFTNYSYLKTIHRNDTIMEVWVPTNELETYQKGELI